MPRITGSKKKYQTYYRDPITRAFVAIEGVTATLEEESTIQGQKFRPQLSGGIPLISWKGNRFRAPFGTPGQEGN